MLKHAILNDLRGLTESYFAQARLYRKESLKVTDPMLGARVSDRAKVLEAIAFDLKALCVIYDSEDGAEGKNLTEKQGHPLYPRAS